jgi:phosphomevalonate kinase
VADVIDETKTLSIEIKDRQLRSVCMLPDEVKDKIRPIIREYHAQTEARKAERAQAAKTEIRATMAADPA